MMKRFIVFMLFLGIASYANAGYILNISAPGPIDPGQTLTLSISTDSAGATPFLGPFVVLVESAVGTITGGVINVPPATVIGQQFFPTADASMMYTSPSTASENLVTGLNGRDGIIGTINALQTYGPWAPGTYVTDITFTGVAGGYANIQLLDISQTYDATDGAVLLGSYQVLVTPEPATLAILGIGSLLLRRKKA